MTASGDEEEKEKEDDEEVGEDSSTGTPSF